MKPVSVFRSVVFFFSFLAKLISSLQARTPSPSTVQQPHRVNFNHPEHTQNPTQQKSETVPLHLYIYTPSRPLGRPPVRIQKPYPPSARQPKPQQPAHNLPTDRPPTPPPSQNLGNIGTIPLTLPSGNGSHFPASCCANCCKRSDSLLLPPSCLGC